MFTIISRPRQAGKTHQIVEWVKAGPNRVMICHSAEEAARVRKEYDLPMSQVVSWGVWERGSRRFGNDEIAIDNLNMILRRAIGNVKMVSRSSDA